MPEWVPCGLPWATYTVIVPTIKPPNTSRQERAQFGVSFAKTKLTDKESLALFDVTINASIRGDSREQQERRLAEKAGKLDLWNRQKLADEIDTWRQKLPQWEEYSRLYEEELQRLREEEAKNSFTGRGLNKPGTLVEVGGKVYLLGDINCLRGVCDDCTEFETEAIVTRYMVLDIPYPNTHPQEEIQ